MFAPTQQFDDDVLARVPLGRSRALVVLAGALFGAALQLTNPPLARASHKPVPYPCFAFPECHCCAGFNCCPQGTCGPPGQYLGCPTGTQCWYTCDCTELYKCCDWLDPAAGMTSCVCSGLIEFCQTC